MGLAHLSKNEKAIKELAEKGMALTESGPFVHGDTTAVRIAPGTMRGDQHGRCRTKLK